MSDALPRTIAPNSVSLVEPALQGLCVGVVVTTRAGRISWTNRAAQRLLGLDPDECRGRPLAQEVRDPGLAAFWQEALASRQTLLGRVSLRWPRETCLNLSATTSVSPRGDFVGRALILCDVTAERQAAEHPPDVRPAAPLTPQERRVLGYVGAGLSNRRIAAEMAVAASTVRTHLKHVYAKLGLHSRAEAIRHALRHGLA